MASSRRSFGARRTVTWYGVNYAERRTGYAIVRAGQPMASMLTMDKRERQRSDPGGEDLVMRRYAEAALLQIA